MSRRSLRRQVSSATKVWGGICLLAILFSLRMTPIGRPLESFFLEGAGGIFSFVSTLTSWGNLENIYPEKALLKKLKKENAVLRGYLARLYVTDQDNALLKQQLHYVQGHAQRFVTAPILSAPAVNETFIVGAGVKQGIQKGHAVVMFGGLVGRVETVSDTTARVLPLTHARSRVPVVSQKTKAHAILVGNGTNRPLLKYRHKQPDDAHASFFVTSSYGGGFPPGILIGRSDDASSARLTPLVSWDLLEDVHILIDPLRDAY